MSQIKSKFLEANAVDDSKIKLRNDQYLKARNAADSADVNILKLNASDVPEFAFFPEKSGTPTSANQLVNKSYVDSVATGLDVKASVRLATAAALPANTSAGSGVGKTLTADANGALSVDGVAVAVGNRILVKDEATALDNGIYVVTAAGDGSNPYVLTRAIDADQDAEVTSGMFTFVEEGSSNDNSGWVLSTNNPITVDTTALAFSKFSDSAAVVITNEKETFTLNGTDITNQYIDLANVARNDSIHFMVKGSGSLLEGASHDYSVSYTGGAGGNTRITFLNDLATGGNAALIAGDIVQVQYEF